MNDEWRKKWMMKGGMSAELLGSASASDNSVMSLNEESFISRVIGECELSYQVLIGHMIKHTTHINEFNESNWVYEHKTL